MFNEPRSPNTGSSSMRAWASSTGRPASPAQTASSPHSPVRTRNDDNRDDHEDGDFIQYGGDGEYNDDDDDAADGDSARSVGQARRSDGLPPSSATSAAGWARAGAGTGGVTNDNAQASSSHASSGAGRRAPSIVVRPGAVRSDSLSSHGTAAVDPWGSSGANTGIAPFAAGGAFVSQAHAHTSSPTARQLPPRSFAGAGASSLNGWGGSATTRSVDEATSPNGNRTAPAIYASIKPPPGMKNLPTFAGQGLGHLVLPSSTSAGWHTMGSNFISQTVPADAPLPTVRLSSTPTSDSTNPVVQLFTQHNTYVISTPPAGLVGLTDNVILQHHADAGRSVEVERRYSDFTWLADIIVKRYPFRCLPSLPPKRVTVPLPGPHLSTDSVFLEQRRKGLQRYVRALFCHPVLSTDDLVITFLTEAQTINHWRSNREPPLCVEEAYSQPLTEVEEMSIPSDLIPAKIQRTRAVLPNLVERWRVLTALFERIARRREAEGLDWKRLSNVLGEMSSLEGRRWRPELLGGGAGAGILGRAYKKRNERQRASMFASSGPFAGPGANAGAGPSGSAVRHSSFLAASSMNPSISDDGRAGGFGEDSFDVDGILDNKNATSAEETLRKVARACGDWSEGMKARSVSSLESTLEDIKYQRDLWTAFRDMLYRWDKLGGDSVDTIKRRMEQNQHKLSSLSPPAPPAPGSAAPSESAVSTASTAASIRPRAPLTAHELEQVKTLRTSLANDAQLVSQLLARRTHTQWVLWNELRWVHEASAESVRSIWKRWTREEREFVVEHCGASLHALEMLLAEL